jgi:hypothetical protein
MVSALPAMGRVLPIASRRASVRLRAKRMLDVRLKMANVQLFHLPIALGVVHAQIPDFVPLQRGSVQ